MVDPTLELYKLYVEMADAISARRATANNTLLGANTAILGVAGLLLKDYFTATSGQIRSDLLNQPYMLGVAGFLCCSVWLLAIWAYARKTSAKGEVIAIIEAELNSLVKPFSTEEECLADCWYARPALVECGLPIVFQVAYVGGLYFFAVREITETHVIAAFVSACAILVIELILVLRAHKKLTRGKEGTC